MPPSVQKRRVAFLHTAAPAIPPLAQFYATHAPDLDITNLMEDGIIRLLGAGRAEEAEQRLRALVETACDVYDAELAMITCSSVSIEIASRLESEFNIPVIKIDGPMARRAVETGPRIGVAVTFEGTIEPTTRLLRETAAQLHRPASITIEMVPGAYQALFAGDTATHDNRLVEGVKSLAARGVDSIVLAQVSMGRARELAQNAVSIPVLSSFDTSLEAIRAALDAAPASE